MQNEKRKKKLLVIGLGPIGGIFSCHLKASGCSIYGIDVRKELVYAIQENGISIEGLTSLQAHPDQVCTQLSELKEKHFDYVIIAVKTPYMAEVVSSLSNLKDDFKIVSMQNGIDNEEYLAKFFPKKRVLRVVINYAGNAISPSVVKMTFFHKPNYVGCLCGKEDCAYAKEFSDLMTDAGLDTEPTLDVKKLAWRKTILVAALAPISALLGMTMAEVMSMGETRYLVEMLLEEAVEVARGKSFDFGDDFIEYSLKYLSTAGHHKPSMLIDVEKGDPTEIEYINGKISFYGHELDIPAHLNTYLTLLVKAKEQFQIRKKNNTI
jgi:2-dehydropantoate 2-reductase